MTLLEATIKKNREKEKNENELEVKLVMAIGLYEDGVDHEIIKRRTGYSVEEIKEAIKRRNQPTKEAA